MRSGAAGAASRSVGQITRVPHNSHHPIRGQPLSSVREQPHSRSRASHRSRAVVHRFLLLVPLASGCLSSTDAVVWQDEAVSAPSIELEAAGDVRDSANANAKANASERANVNDDANERVREAALQRVLDGMPEAAIALVPTAALPALETVPAPNAALGDGPEPRDDARCDASLRERRTTRGDVAVWWSLRPGNRVHLIAAWRDVGQATWRGPIVVDSLDVGSTDARDVAEGAAVGCGRPAPGLAVDGVNGYVHVSYALVGPEGPGIFYAHQMDPRAAFEPPVPIVYGERLGEARVASDGDLVAVAYVDPNSGVRPRIALAVSRLAGHLFERRLTVNAGLNPASRPVVVARGTALVVGWEEAPPSGGAPAFLLRRAVVR
jgi:hypothetical protein